MRRSKFWLRLPVLLAGCGPSVTPVRVDTGRILLSETQMDPADPAMPSPPAPSGARKVVIPGFRSDVLEDPSQANAAKVGATIEAQQQEALRQLEKRLRAVYAEEARVFELTLKRELQRSFPEAYDIANRRIRERFETYADERAPLAAELYNLVGFPDPNPKSDPPRSKLGKVDQMRFDRAVVIRVEMRKVEDAYQRDKEAILSEAADKLSEAEAAALTRIREYADDMERRAAREAAEQVQLSLQDLGLQLTDPQPIRLRSTPARTVQIPAEKTLPPAPQVPSSRIPSAYVDRRRRLERELDIWLRVNRFRLDPQARDATEEFQTWRKSHGAGL